MTKELDKLAASLSEAQRRLVLSSEMTSDGRVLIDAFPPHGLNAHLVFMHSMARDRLTPLGLQLRDHLNNLDKAGEASA